MKVVRMEQSQQPNTWIMSRLLYVRDAAQVKRNHTERVRAQLCGEHVAGVCEIILAVRPGASAELLTYALRHDVYERTTGDAPAPAKWMSPELTAAHHVLESRLQASYGLLPGISDEDMLLFKWADMAEFVFFSLEERKTGNEWAERGLVKGWAALGKLKLGLDDTVAAMPIINYLKTQLERYLDNDQ